MNRTAILAGLVILAIGLRLVAMGVLRSPPAMEGEERTIARNLASGQGYSFTAFSHLGPTSIRPPVYPLLISGLYAIFGMSDQADRAALWLNAFASGLSVIVAFALGRRLFQHARSPILLAGLMAVMPSQVYGSLYPQGLSVAILFTLTTLWLATWLDLRLALPAGLCAGLAVLTESILVLPLVLVILFISTRRPTFALLMLAGSFTLVTPWVYRNSLIQHQLTGITNELWSDVFAGNGTEATGSDHLHLRGHDGKPLSRLDRLSPQQADLLKRQPEAGRNQYFKTWSLEWIHHHPLAYARLCLARIGKTLWLDWSHPIAWQPVYVVIRSGGLLALAAVLLWYLRNDSASSAGSPTLSPARLAGILTLGLVLASAFTLAEARNSVLLDIPQLLAVALLADRKYGTCVTC